MQMLGTWLVEFQAIRLDGGWCFKGVHLSQVHQQSKSYFNIARLVHLRQVHPLKIPLKTPGYFTIFLPPTT